MTIRIAIIFTLLASSIYGQQWQWANSNGGSGNIDRNIIITRDNSGNILMTGEFEGTKLFGTFSLTATGSRDVFVAKYDATGSCLWAVKGGGFLSDNDGVGIATDNNGNVYVSGNFSNNITFVPYSVNQITNSSNSFIAKFDPSGNCQFLKAIYSNGAVVMRSLQCNGTDVLITGAYADSTYFDAIGVTSASSEIFLAKFDAQGNFLWVKTAGGPDEDSSVDLAIGANGNIYLAGFFKLTATFGTNNVTSYGNHDIFVAGFDANGNNLWVTGAGSNQSDQAIAVDVDNAGNCYATGYYYPTPSGMTTLPAHFGSFQLPDNGSGNMFVAKYDTTGNTLWAKYGGGSSHDEGIDINTDANGNSYVTGVFVSNASFGGFPITSNGGSDAFLVKYNTYGGGLFTLKIGGTGNEKGKSVLSYPNGDCIVAGNYTTSITINTTPSTTLNSPASEWRVFMAKYSGGSVGIGDPVMQQNNMQLYPNPASDGFTVTLMSEGNDNIRFEIVNAIGQVVQHYENRTAAGLNDFRFDASKLSPGSYLLKVTGKGYSLNKQLLISR